MSARVFNPIVMSELNRLRGASGSSDRRSAASPSYSTLAKVRRDLFGPVDHDESLRMVERELSRHIDCATERWGFDFRHGVPVDGHHKYSWKGVSANEVPQPFLGSCVRVPMHRPVPVTPITPREHDDCDGDDAQNDVLTVNDILEREERTDRVTVVCRDLEQQTSARDQMIKRECKQSLITNYMKSRKRAHSSHSSFVSTAKKMSADSTSNAAISPAKIARRMQFS